MPGSRPPLLKRLRPRRLAVRFGPNGRRLIELHDTLEGLLAIDETRFLYTAPASIGARTIVEIGSFRGKSAALMALGAPGARLTCIDPHEPTHFGSFSDDDHAAFMRTIESNGVSDRVTHVRERSHDARAGWPSETPIDFLWIDGDHSYEGAKRDFEDWSTLVRPGGIVAAHDAFRERFPGVLRAWREIVEADARFGPTRRVRTIAWAERVG